MTWDSSNASFAQHAQACPNKNHNNIQSFLIGLYGKDAVEQAGVDMYIDGCVDLYPKFAPYFEARIKGDQEAMVSIKMTMFSFTWRMSEFLIFEERNYNEFKEKQLTAFLDRYSSFLKANSSGWFVGDRVSSQKGHSSHPKIR